MSARTETSGQRAGRLLAIVLALLLGAGVGYWRARTAFHAQTPLELDYVVRVVDPETAELEVLLEVAGMRRDRLHLGFSPNAIASTAPASKFAVREASGIDGSPSRIIREPGEWTLDGALERIRIRYSVQLMAGRQEQGFADEALSHLDRGGGRLLGTDVFLFPLDADAASIRVRYELPEGWRLHHPFPVGSMEGAPPNLPALYGSVAAVGPYRTLTRRVGDAEIVLAVRGRFAFGDDDLMRVLQRITRHQLEFFGQAPQRRFLFIVDPHPDADDPDRLHYFGLHFQASMVLLIDPRTDRVRLQAEPASLCAHEFFHTWLGEQLRQEDYSMNWFVEGVTSLYADRTRLATRMLDRGRHAQELRTRYSEDYEPSMLRRRMSVAEAGEQVLQSESTTDLLYSGGTLLAVALEDEIRIRSQASASLDDLVRRLVALAVEDPLFVLDRDALEQELQRLTGSSFAEWLDLYVYGTQPMPLPAYVLGR